MRTTPLICLLFIPLFIQFAVCPVLAQKQWIQLDSAIFIRQYPTARVVDKGGLLLYTYRKPEDKTNDSSDPPFGVVGFLMMEIADGPADYFFVQVAGKVVQPVTEKGFQDRIKVWFADDTALLNFIKKNDLKNEHLPYLVMMYNRHAPRPFDPDFKPQPVEFVPKGFMDPRDGKQYDIVNSYNQSWFAENLQYCSSKECSDNSCEKCRLYGGYYSWENANKVCPPGWRLPDDVDWHIFLMAYGLAITDFNKFTIDKNGTIGKQLLKNDKFPDGFNALTGGMLGNNGLKEENETANFWSNTEIFDYSADVIYISKTKKKAELIITYYNKDKKMNVRCVTTK